MTGIFCEEINGNHIESAMAIALKKTSSYTPESGQLKGKSKFRGFPDMPANMKPIMTNKEKYLREMARNREILAGEPQQKERLEAVMGLCFGCVLVAEENLNLDMGHENADLMEEFLVLAHEAEGYDHLLNDLYSACGRMAETVCCHPRLMARFKRFYRQVVYRIESAFCNGHELALSGDLSQEISMLESNIWFADNGKWDEIMAIDLLKSDPVEWSEEFENVIDEVEKELYEYFKDESRCMGFCFEFWSRKKALLARRGLEWRTPSEMNPRVIFD